jgi:hypothetical protein
VAGAADAAPAWARRAAAGKEADSSSIRLNFDLFLIHIPLVIVPSHETDRAGESLDRRDTIPVSRAALFFW